VTVAAYVLAADVFGPWNFSLTTRGRNQVLASYLAHSFSLVFHNFFNAQVSIYGNWTCAAFTPAYEAISNPSPFHGGEDEGGREKNFI
jgi:hypothetical protein